MVILALALLGCTDGTTTNDSSDSGTLATTSDGFSLVDAAQGDPGLQSVHMASFAPDGTLAIADGRAEKLVAIGLPAGEVTTHHPDIDDVYQLVAEAFGDSKGTDANIRDITVNPQTGRIYLVAERLSTGEAALFQVNDDDTLSVVDLSDVPFSAASLESSAGADASVMALEWAGDHLVAAVTSATWTLNEVMTVDVPIAHEDASAVAGTYTYHRSHRQWETRAPVVSLAAYNEADEDYVAATYTCTPTVRFTGDALAAGESETLGETPFDYGGGKQVMDMVVNDEGVYATIDGMFPGSSGWAAFGAVRVDRSLLVQSEELDEDANTVLQGSDTASHAAASRIEALDGAYRLAKLGDTHVVALQNAGLKVIEVSAP